MTMTDTRTQYHGIWIHFEDGSYWITDDNGGDQFIGPVRPTATQIDDYRRDVVYWLGYPVPRPA